jgi:gamma-glutamyl:cysteine ligase YbdK (ATP-grasp superfamily)
MGEEIEYSHFKQSDYALFRQNLEEETRLLQDWFHRHQLSSQPPVAGYELEAWLIDARGEPCPKNTRFLDAADNALLSPELARFNIELNVVPQPLGGAVLSDFSQNLDRLWRECTGQAEKLDCHLLGIGILPSLRDEHLTLDNISGLDRYKALNEQVLRLRKGRSIELNIVGHEHLQSQHMDVMLEAAATSLQIHIQVPQHQAVRYYNAAIALSAPMVAVSANAPFMFGKQLWEETRIPVFEQSVPTGGFEGACHGPVQRVGFGMGYARASLFECFAENLEHYPIMLPIIYDHAKEQLQHLRLHNGTIWRWNRPLIGFDADGTPHLRIEHRVCSSGASMQDNIANMALFYGLVHYYATIAEPPEQALSFSQSRDNFYHAAQHGLDGTVQWTEQQRIKMQKLVLDQLLIEAETGLRKLGIAETDIKHNLRIIEKRTLNKQTGSQWQKQFAALHNFDMQKLTRQYLHNQRSNIPVHCWDFASETLSE